MVLFTGRSHVEAKPSRDRPRTLACRPSAFVVVGVVGVVLALPVLFVLAQPSWKTPGLLGIGIEVGVPVLIQVLTRAFPRWRFRLAPSRHRT